MWARNLLFVAIVGGGILALRESLFPQDTEARTIHFEPGSAAEDEFQSVVRRVDDSFRADWKAKGLSRAPARQTSRSRGELSLALTGSVPSLEEIRQFEAQPEGKRLDGWVNHLLRDRRFADYFADRFARAYVGTEDGPLLLYRKRRFTAWLAGEFHKNAPYGEVVRQMIAERGLNTDRPAVNFIAATYDDEREGPDAEKLAIRVSRAFLGLRIDCAQCHNFYDREHPKYNDEGREVPAWKQTEFQALAAFFGQTRHVVTHVTDGEGVYRYEDRVKGGTKEIDEAVPFLPELLPADGTRRERLAAWVTHPRNVHFSRATVNRVWAMMFGRPLMPKVEAQSLEEKVPPTLDILAADFAAHNHDLRRLVLLIASTQAFRLDSAARFEVTEAHEDAWAVFPMSRLRPEQVIGSVIQTASVRTIDQNSQVFVRLTRYFNEQDFVRRYGDSADDDFAKSSGTIPQRLLMMNGDLVDGKVRAEILNASTQIALFAPDDRGAVETAYLCVLTRRPTQAESDHFAAKLAGKTGDARRQAIADLYWVLFNSTEFSWLS